jgi:hypothetical protein
VVQPPGPPPEYGPPPAYGPPPEYGPPQYGQPQYGQPQYGQPPGYPPMGPVGTNQYYGALAPRPGCVPLRPLGLGDILDGSFTAIRRNPRATLGLSAVVAVVQAAVLAAVQIFALSQISGAIDNTDPNNPNVNVGRLVSGELSALVGAVVGSLFAAVLAGMLTVVITEDVLGKRLAMGEVWNRTRPRIWKLVGLSFLVGLVPFLGLLLCLAPGIWLWGIWAVAVPALVVENTSVLGSLGRSRDLVSGTFWRVWGIRALGVGMVSLIGTFVNVPFALVAGAVTGNTPFSFTNATTFSLPAVYVLITSIGSILTLTFTAPVRAGIDALLYVDLRMRKEGLDIALQQTAARIAAEAAGSGSSSPSF